MSLKMSDLHLFFPHWFLNWHFQAVNSIFWLFCVCNYSCVDSLSARDSFCAPCLVGFMVLAGQERLLPKKEEIFNCSDACSAPVCSQWIDMALPKSGVGVFLVLRLCLPCGLVLLCAFSPSLKLWRDCKYLYIPLLARINESRRTGFKCTTFSRHLDAREP